MVDGRILRRNNRFAAIDEDKVVAEASEAADGLKERAKWA